VSSSDDDADDVDSHGNIKGLIDYDYDDEAHYEEPDMTEPPRVMTRSARKKCGAMVPLTRRRSSEGRPQPGGAVDQSLAKLLLLTQLCNQVECVEVQRNPRRRRKKRKKKRGNKSAEETKNDEEDEEDNEDNEDNDDNEEDNSDEENNSDETSDGEWLYPDEEEDEDLEDGLTHREQQYFSALDKKKRKKYSLAYDEIMSSNSDETPLKFRILDMQHVSMRSRTFLLNRLKNYQMMEPGANEYYKLHTWFTQFNKLPLGKYAQFPLTRKSNKRTVFKYLSDARRTLDKAVFGHDHVKDDIVQMIASWISSDNGIGQVLALKGPPGNGKTTIVKNGLAKVLGRPFAMIALGGAKDSAFLQGHEYTFEGSKPGRILEVIRDAGVMNPVIFFDEVDKLSDSPAGKEISNLLCHLLDPVQNALFQDRYMSGIDIDLSKAVFVLSFNDETKVDPILKDRMRVINMKGFKVSDKLDIAKRYLLPTIMKEIKFKSNALTISDDVLKFIVTEHTKEQGVRDLRRCLNTIVTKLNVLRMIGKRTPEKVKQVVNYNIPNIKFPLSLTIDHARILLSKDKVTAMVPSMYM